ncbi:MAG: adenylate/guanylate cyclase domain-containing protein, partial [Pseudomonadota bacterium]
MTDGSSATLLDRSADIQASERTLLFTDIEGSTALLERLGPSYSDVLLRHHELMRQAISRGGGTEVETAGDAFFVVFPDATSALLAAVHAQSLLQSEPWVSGASVWVRMGIHHGPTKVVNGQFVGIDVHRAARICSCGNGGQIVLSREAAETVNEASLPASVGLRKLGRHRLKDLRYPETLFDVVASDLEQILKPVRSLNNRPTNLALNQPDLLGRAIEIAEVQRRLEDPTRRLVTLTGTGGVGKSSLARKVGAEAIESFTDGVYFFELSSITDPNLVLPTVAKTIGVRDFPGRPILVDIAAAVGTEHQLFILDTFEHLMDARGDIGKLIEACPHLHMIITSRSGLKLSTETILDVAPLEVPAETATRTELLENPSAVLFATRVKDLLPDFAVDETNARTIALICRRLEGIPLAIELAAARVRLIGVDSLLDRLSAVLKLLKGGGGGTEDRHRTLRAAIQWSDDLLSPSERSVFRLVSVFNGGFRFDDAEVMLMDLLDELDPDIDLLTEVESLVDNGLLLSTSIGGEPRLKMLDMVREYASAAHAAEADPTQVNDLHLAHFTKIAETCASMALNAGQRPHVGRLENDIDNIRAALSWALEIRDLRSVSRIFYALHWYWISQAQFTEALSWLDKAVGLAEALGEDDEATALINEAACSLRMGSGDYAGGEPFGDKAVKIFQALGDKAGEMRASLTQCICATVVGKIEDPSEILMGAIEMFRGTDDYHAALGLILLGEGARMEGVLDAAEGCYTDAMTLLEASENVFWPGHLKQNIAHFRLKDGDWQSAAALLADAFDLAEDFDFPLVSNLAVAGFGGVAIARGDAEMAARILGAVEHNLQKIGVVFEPTDQADVDRYVSETKSALGEETFAR